MSESLIFAHFLFFGERCEWIAHFAHQKWATMSDSLRSLREMSDVSESLISLTKNEGMSESLIFLSESLICSFLYKKQAICSEIKLANSQPCSIVTVNAHLVLSNAHFKFQIAEKNV